MAKKRLCKLLFSISIIACLVGLIIQISLAISFLSPVWALDSLNRDVNPTLTAPLSEYEYIISDKTNQYDLLGEKLHQAHPFIKVCPSCNISYLRYYVSQHRFTDNRIKIRYLILSHFHGSRYKDVISLS